MGYIEGQTDTVGEIASKWLVTQSKLDNYTEEDSRSKMSMIKSGGNHPDDMQTNHSSATPNRASY